MKDQIDSPLSILLSEILLLDNRIKRPPLTNNALLSKVHTYMCVREKEKVGFLLESSTCNLGINGNEKKFS